MADPLPLLSVPAEPEVLIWMVDAAVAADAVSVWVDAGLTVRVVRGRKMPVKERLFDEFAAALQFPWYFGENWDAFDECLTDLSWLPSGAGIVLVITDPVHVLSSAEERDLEVLVSFLSNAVTEWATPVELGEWWDRAAVPFHVILQVAGGDASDVRARWLRAGATIASFGE